MTRYIIRRILVTVPMLLVLSVIVFSLIQLAPGDPTVFFIPSNYSEVSIDVEEFRAKIRHELGLDQPVYVQYLSWLSKTVRGDLGYAFTYRVPVVDLIGPRIWPTVVLQLAALTLAVAVAIPVGILSASRQYSITDHVVTFLSFLGISVPSFWLALLLMILFAVWLGWLPSGGAGLGKPLIERIPYFILPTIVLATEYVAWYARFMRSSTLEVLKADYVTTAKSKGLANRRVLYSHVLKNALLPLITIVGLSLPRLVGGAIIVEAIFAWPGLGRLAYDAVLRRDQPVILALTLLTSVVIAFSNLLVDIGYVAVDPRISYSGGDRMSDADGARANAWKGRQTSQLALAWRGLKRHHLALAGLVIITFLIIAALFAPYLAPYDPAEQGLRRLLLPPSRSHLMGTDDLGRDIFSRVLVGSRSSLQVAFVAVAILITIGVFVGMLAGYYRSLDSPLMRGVDVLMSIPSIFLILAIVALFGPGLRNTMLVIGFTSWMGTARLVRGQFLSIREKDYIEAAHAVGVTNARIILRHIMPNTMSVVIVQATLFISFAIITESLLSYLGLGVQPPDASWGNILSNGRNYMREAWWMTFFPGLAIFVTVLSFNFLGDGLRDALDPHHRSI